MKKIRVDKKIQISIMVGMMALVAISSVLCLREFGREYIVEEEKVLYEYTHANEVEYAVNLLPNQIYETDKLPEGQIYLTEFIRSINTYFTSTFIGSDEASIQGEYEVVAQVAGYTTEKETKIDIWNKEFVLASKKSFEGQGKEYKLEKTVSIDYPGYTQFASSVAEAAKVNLPMELRIIMRGNMSAKTPYEVVDKPINTFVVIPLSSNYFSIETEGVEKSQDSIKETVEIGVPADKKIIAAYGALVIVAILVFGATLVLLEPLSLEDMNTKKIKGISNTHGSRMVGVDDIKETGYETIYRVKDIDDLIKIADELERPLLYKYSEDILEINKFYVIDKETLYLYEIDLYTTSIANRPIKGGIHKEGNINRSV